MHKIFERNKKKGAGQALLISLLAIIGVVALVMFAYGKYSGKPTSLTITNNNPSGSGGSSEIPSITLTDRTTVTFSSWNARNKATSAGVGHLLLEADSKSGSVKFVGSQIADDGTLTLAPGDTYRVLLGNLTTGLTANTNYYPVYMTGSIPDIGSYSIAGGQYLTAGASQITFTVTNANGQVNTAQAMTTSDDKTVKLKFSPNADTCFGNPDTGAQTGGVNVITYGYNSTTWSGIIQYNNGNPESTVGTPTGAQTALATNTSLQQKVSYPLPPVCGPAEAERSVRLQSTSATNPSALDNIAVVGSDISWGVNSRTFDLISGYTDNNNVDLGVADFTIGTIQVS